MQPLTKSGNDLSKGINQLNSTNTALIKTSVSSYRGKNKRCSSKQSKPSTAATNTPKKLAFFPERLCSRGEMDKTAEQQIYQKLNLVSSNKGISEFVAGNIKNFIEN